MTQVTTRQLIQYDNGEKRVVELREDYNDGEDFQTCSSEWLHYEDTGSELFTYELEHPMSYAEMQDVLRLNGCKVVCEERSAA